VKSLGQLWDVTLEDAQGGHIQAVCTTKLMRFKDDVIIRIRKAVDADGSNYGARVDVRSRSRIGKGDLGCNAHRILTLLSAIEAHADAK